MFVEIKKGMPNGAEALQENFAKLDKSISNVSDDGTLETKAIDTEKLLVSGLEFMTEPKDLTPYLTPEFESAGAELSYLIMGKVVHISGAVQPKKDIDATKQPRGGMVPVYTKLPFEIASGQMYLNQGADKNQFAMAASGTSLNIHKHQKAGAFVPMTKGGYMAFAGSFIIK